MNLGQYENGNGKKRTLRNILPCKPEVTYLAIFLFATVSIPSFTSYFFYNIVLPDWSQPNSEDDFHNIKQILVRYGNLSSKESEEFSSSNILGHSNSYAREAVRLAQLEMSFENLSLRLILPILIFVGVYTVFMLRFWLPGVTKSRDPVSQSNKERMLENLPPKTLDFLNDFNRVCITVAGFIISILGGFLVSSGLNNFYFFLGFETIVISLIAFLMAYPSFISSTNLDPKHGETINTSNLKGYFRIANFGTWCLILGLMLLATSFS